MKGTRRYSLEAMKYFQIDTKSSSSCIYYFSVGYGMRQVPSK